MTSVTNRICSFKQTCHPPHNNTKEKARLNAQITKLKQEFSVGQALNVWSPKYGYALFATVEHWSDSEVHLKYTDDSREICTWSELLPRLEISTVLKHILIIEVIT